MALRDCRKVGRSMDDHPGSESLRGLRRAALLVDAASAEHAAAVTRAQLAGVASGAIAVASRPGGGLRRRRWRPRVAASDTAGADVDAQQEALAQLRRATERLARARDARHAAIRHAARLGEALDLVSREAHLPLPDVERAVQRVPVT